MKIGEHKGFRADKDGRLGYVFPTIRSNTNYMLFIYDKPKTGHSASTYFDRHPEHWKREYNTRCYWTGEKFVKIFTESKRLSPSTECGMDEALSYEEFISSQRKIIL